MATPPTVSVNLGDPIADVVRGAGFSFPRTEVLDFDLHVVQEPCVVRYAHPQKPINLPATRFVSFELTLARVARFRTSPQLSYVNREGAATLVLELATTLGDAGWEGPKSAKDEMERVFRQMAEVDSDDTRALVSVWLDGAGTELTVALRRTYKAGGVFDAIIQKQDRFLVDVSVDNAVFHDALDAEVLRERAAAGLPRDKMRTLRVS